jgi:hypothetical protein
MTDHVTHPTIDPATCNFAELRRALRLGATTRDQTERAAVQILTTAGVGDLVGRDVVRRFVFRHPNTGAWLLDWHKFAEHRHDTILSSGERIAVDLACALGADTPVRFLGSNISRLDHRTRRNVVTALVVAFLGEES